MEETFALEILKGYKRSNKILAIALFICLGIICLFVGGLIYIFCNYDFSYDELSTDIGPAVLNKGDYNNAESSISVND